MLIHDCTTWRDVQGIWWQAQDACCTVLQLWPSISESPTALHTHLHLLLLCGRLHDASAAKTIRAGVHLHSTSCAQALPCNIFQFNPSLLSISIAISTFQTCPVSDALPTCKAVAFGRRGSSATGLLLWMPVGEWTGCIEANVTFKGALLLLHSNNHLRGKICTKNIWHICKDSLSSLHLFATSHIQHNGYKLLQYVAIMSKL